MTPTTMRLELLTRDIADNRGFIMMAVVAVLILLAVWKLPRWQVRRLGSLTDRELFECENEARKTIAQLIGGGLLLAGLYYTAETLRVNQETLRATQERQVADLYSRAVEQIAHSSVQVRLGGIYALERVAAESSRYQPIVIDVLGAFVRNRASWNWSRQKLKASRSNPDRHVATDVEAAVATLLRSTPEGARFVPKASLPNASLCLPSPEFLFDDGCIGFTRPPSSATIKSFMEQRHTLVDLTSTDLPRLQLASGTNLMTASLSWSNLEGAALSDCQCAYVWLVGARLVGASFENARLNLANLNLANLENANLTGADLRRASVRQTNFGGADLTGARLQGLDLTTAAGLTKSQLAAAFTDEATKIPGYIR